MVAENLSDLGSLPLGMTVSGPRVGYKNRGKVVLVACRQCEKRYWVQKARIPPTGLCLSCSASQTVRSAQEANRGRIRPWQSERQRGDRNWMWKGGVIRGGKKGRYTLVLLLPDDPYYCMANSMGYVIEHRLNMAKALGRPLTATEQVHHINGNRCDNRLENLELWQHSHPSGVRANSNHKERGDGYVIDYQI